VRQVRGEDRGGRGRLGVRHAGRTRFSQRASYRWLVLGMAFLAVFGAIGLGRFGYSAILPAMQEALGITSAAAGGLASWNLAGYVTSAAVGGILASRFGPRLVVGIGSVVAAVGMLCTGLANELVAASAGRLLTGLGAGMVLVPSVALMSAWFGIAQRGMASAVVSSGSSLALVIAGPVVPRIIEAGGADGWRSAWYFFAGLTFVVGLLTFALQRNRPASSEPSASAESIWTADPGVPRHACTPDEAAIAVALSTWSAVRRRARRSKVDLARIVRSGYAWHLGFVYLTFGFAYMIYFTFFQKRLIADVAMTSGAAGNLFLLVGIFSIFCGVLWGTVSDRIGRGRALALTFFLQAVAAVLFAWWPATPGLIVSVTLYGLTSLAVPGIVGAACGDHFGAVLASASLGLVTIFLGVGQVLGPYLAGKMADIFGSLQNSYLLAAAVFFVGSLLSLFLPRSAVAECD